MLLFYRLKSPSNAIRPPVWRHVPKEGTVFPSTAAFRLPPPRSDAGYANLVQLCNSQLHRNKHSPSDPAEQCPHAAGVGRRREESPVPQTWSDIACLLSCCLHASRAHRSASSPSPPLHSTSHPSSGRFDRQTGNVYLTSVSWQVRLNASVGCAMALSCP